MDPIVEIPVLNLEETTSGGKDSFSNDSVTVASGPMATKEEKNLIRDEDIDYKSRTKRHTERENEISNADQVREDASAPPEGSSSPEAPREGCLKQETRDTRRQGPAPAAETPRSSPRAEDFPDGPPKFPPSRERDSGKKNEKSMTNPIWELKMQNFQLMEALLKFQKEHATEKKRFHEILFGIDKALSSLPIRLEKIRVRNQRNLSIINSSRFPCGDGEEDASGMSQESSSSDSLTSTQESNCYLSARMKCLLKKMDQINDLVHNIKQGDSSPIELLVDSELYAISLLKKEIKSTKKRIEENKTETDTVTSCNESNQLTEDSSSKAKNSFSNELDKARNFKIFENHMMLQEEALNLLTRKIKETEEALSKEVGEKEALKSENKTLAKEIFRLKSAEEETKRGKLQKIEKLKPDLESLPNRPYMVIKELKAKLEEKEKSLLSWKSKYSRMEAASTNKSALLEREKRKTLELETTLKNMKAHNKSVAQQMSSLQFLNEQLRNQSEILKHQVEILANERLQHHINPAHRAGEGEGEGGESLRDQDAKLKKLERQAENKLREMRKAHEKELEEVLSKLKISQRRNEEFVKTFREYLNIVNNSGMERDIKSIKNPSYDRIREILQISPSELQLLFSTYAKNSTRRELENLYKEFESIVCDEEEEFSENLSVWLFEVTSVKLLPGDTDDNNNNNDNN